MDLGTTLSVLRLSWIPVNQGRRKTRVCEFPIIFHTLGSVQQDLPVPDQSQLKVTKVEETPKVYSIAISCFRMTNTIFQVFPDISLNQSMRGDGSLSSMMASSLGRMTLTSLGFGRDLSQSVDYRLPPVVHDADGKLVQVGSGNTSPDAQGVRHVDQILLIMKWKW